MIFSFWVSLGILAASVILLLEVAWGARRIGQLKDVPARLAEQAPKVSVIVPALNEEDGIEAALLSLLKLDYPDLEIIAADDRSTDATPAILDRLAAAHPQLRVLHINSLPQGWLGKNHALWQGAQQARGDYLLFTDADVVFEVTSLARAIAYCERHRVDHLTLLFDVVANTLLLRMLVLSFSVNFLARFKPWKVSTSPAHFIGAGGFNLVRAQAYRDAGGHAAIPLAVLDDVMLGKLLKSKGWHQHVLFGQGLVAVEWYRNTPELANGMQKNIFAAFDYRVGKLVAVTILMLLFRVSPWVGLFATEGAAWLCNAATVLAGLALYVDMLRASGWGYRCLVFAPFVSVIELAIWWRGSLLTLLKGSIDWRGTRYSLDALRRAQD
ncbi:glycosyltransferase [Noviherbaspirillum massiliense]|uniref:glycosyltransferase n=1 Tax=Noviherbaspirillum massiliense TaxID=1465823 RepID=UPI0002F3860D|nr:glycosyltransferase family 2 protein [Noviherbaspirillum massiliense]